MLLRLVRARGWRGHQSRIRQVRCGAHALRRVAHRGWILPPGCDEVRWRVPLQKVRFPGYQVSSRRPAVDRAHGWILVPGSSALLVPAGGAGPATIRIRTPPGLPLYHALEPAGAGRLRLPDLPDAPRVVLGAGRFSVREETVARLRVRCLTPRPALARLGRILAAHAPALRYLVRVFGRPAVPRLQAYFLPLDASAGSVSGHATHRTVVLNLVPRVRPVPHLHPALVPWLGLVLLLHEQVHQLTGDLPPWLGESLAQYYALKALREAGVLRAATWRAAFDRIRRPWTLTPDRDTRVPLLAAQRRYARTGDPTAYGLLYTNGVSFWDAIDRAMARHGGAGHGLDHVARALTRLGYPRMDRVPRAFEAQLRRAAGPAAQGLLARWVTGRGSP